MPLIKRKKNRSKKKKFRRIRRDASGASNSSGGASSSSNSSSSIRKKKRSRDSDSSEGRVAKGKIKSTLTVGKTEVNSLRNTGRKISYAFNVNTSRNARKSDAGVSIKSTLYKQGGDKKLRIQKIDFDNPSKFKDTINSIVSMDQVDGKNDPLKKIEIDLAGVANLGKLNDAIKDIDPSVEIEFKFKDKDRNRPYALDDGFAGVKFLMDALKGKPEGNENLKAIEGLVNEANNLQTKEDITVEDMDKIQYLNQQIDGFVKRAETEMNSDDEKRFLDGLKLALELESERVVSDKIELEKSEKERDENLQKESERKKEQDESEQREKDQDQNEGEENQPERAKDQDEQLEKNKGLVVNLDPGDKTIDKAFKDIEKRDTDLESPIRPKQDAIQKDNRKYELFKDFKKDQVDFSEAGKDGPILLLAHGMPRYPWLIPSDSSSTYAFRFANMSAKKFADYLIKNNLPKDYAGIIYLDGCYTASGNTKKNFALQVYNRLVDQGYNFLQVKGNLGAAVTLSDGTEIVTHAAVEKQAEKLAKEVKVLEKRKVKLENEINKDLIPAIRQEVEVSQTIKFKNHLLDTAREDGDKIQTQQLENEIQKAELQKQYLNQIIDGLQRGNQEQTDQLNVLKAEIEEKDKTLRSMKMPALTGTFGPAALPNTNSSANN